MTKPRPSAASVPSNPHKGHGHSEDYQGLEKRRLEKGEHLTSPFTTSIIAGLPIMCQYNVTCQHQRHIELYNHGEIIENGWARFSRTKL
ncbi:hypothetical protein VKT23_004880 [Stygiomarasmius scandens]|uniref:Uncharacterized protein n=1 Tax=Marasmiellus scandens TaxID=2682957 RepID=A0ABR1JXC6_9AGAR